MHNSLKEIDKIDSLKNFVKESNSKLLEDFIIKRFELIDSKKLFHHDEKKYILFFKEYKEKIKIKVNDLYSNVLSSIDWFGNVKNFNMLKDISPDFDDFVKSNQEEVDQKITNAIRKEIEYNGSKSSLEDLILKLNEEMENMMSYSKIDYKLLTSEIEEKIEEIEKEPIEKAEKKAIESDDYNDNSFEKEEIFNEEEFFHIEMFE